jgi:hypothetical protein
MVHLAILVKLTLDEISKAFGYVFIVFRSGG